MTDLYEPNAFFDRVDELWLDGPLVAEPGWRRFAARRRWMQLYKHARSWIESGVLIARIGLQMRDRNLKRIYFDRIWNVLCEPPDGILLRLYAIRCAMHFHLHQLACQLRASDAQLINTY
jgi:hypothetical protein